jgi:preprotein translocase subunit YajC
MSGLLVIGLLFAVFWFMMIRPQRARAREQQELITSLEPGDEIVTAGGLYGVITEVDGEVLHIEIADGLVVRTARNAVAGIVEPLDDEEDEPDDEEDAEGDADEEPGTATDTEAETTERDGPAPADPPRNIA